MHPPWAEHDRTKEGPLLCVEQMGIRILKDKGHSDDPLPIREPLWPQSVDYLKQHGGYPDYEYTKQCRVSQRKPRAVLLQLVVVASQQ